MAQADAALVDVFRNMRRDARNDPTPVEIADTFNIEFLFDGVGQLPVPGDILILSAGRISARLFAAEIVADAIGSAVIDLRIGTLDSWPANSPPYDVIPTLASSAAIEFDVSAWPITSLQPRDVLAAVLVSVESPITCITLTLVYRRLKWPSVNPTIVDNGSNDLVLDNGNLVSLRG